MNNYQEINKILRNKIESRKIQKKLIDQKIENLRKQSREIEENNRKTEEQILKNEKESTSNYLKKEETDYSLEQLQKHPGWNLLPKSEQEDLLSGKSKLSEETKKIIGF